jgi:two-component system OmpR family response regulator
MDTKGRVIIVEDDRDLRESIVQYLNFTGFDAKGVSSALEFYRAVAASTFSIAVVDLGLPDQNGYVLVEYIRKNTMMGAIILTARGGVEDRVLGYDAGADLYLVKPIDCRELAAAIVNLLGRLGKRASFSAQTSVPETWQLVIPLWHLVTPAGEIIKLTAKEMQFIACLAENPGKPFRRETLLAELGYGEDEYANRAMDSLVRRLRRKVEKSWNLPSPIKTIRSVGYCFSAHITIA